MNLIIPQLNFIYLYKICKNSGIDVSRYDEIDVDDIKVEMSKTLILRIINKYNIFEDIIDVKFDNDIENLLNQPVENTLHYISADADRELRYIKAFKNNVKLLLNETEDRMFIQEYKNLITCIPTTRIYLNNIRKYNISLNSKDDNEDILDTIFS